MKMTLDVNLHSLFTIDMEEERFMTSLDVIVETESSERIYKTNNKVNGGGQRVLGLSPCNK